MSLTPSRMSSLADQLEADETAAKAELDAIQKAKKRAKKTPTAKDTTISPNN